MSAFNRGFSMNNYQSMNYPTYQQPQMPVANQGMTLPTIHADIYQVADEAAANSFNVAVGQSQMMMNRDETEIYIKTAYPNGPSTMDVYVKRPAAAPKPEMDPEQYVTKEEFEKRLAALMPKKKEAAAT